jgi:hypothetical protein
MVYSALPHHPGLRGLCSVWAWNLGQQNKAPIRFFEVSIRKGGAIISIITIFSTDVKKKSIVLSEVRGDPDNFARVCQLEAIIENLYPYLDRGGVLTQIEREQRKMMLEHLETLMPWLIPGNR